jgi:hypothetical protein
MIAAVRPDSWNLPLLVHVLGAMVFVGLLLVLAVILVVSLRDGGDRVAALRFAFRTVLLGLLPSYIVMRVGAEWVFSEENADEDAAWIGIGYIVTDLGLLLLIVTAVLLGLARRRAASGTKEPRGLVRPATAITFLLIAAYAVALWAMTAKPA